MKLCNFNYWFKPKGVNNKPPLSIHIKVQNKSKDNSLGLDNAYSKLNFKLKLIVYKRVLVTNGNLHGFSECIFAKWNKHS